MTVRGFYLPGAALDLALLYALTMVGFPITFGHILSLVLSAGILYWWHERKRRTGSVLPGVDGGTYWVVVLTALFLRAGILAWLKEAGAGTSLPALAVAAWRSGWTSGTTTRLRWPAARPTCDITSASRRGPPSESHMPWTCSGSAICWPTGIFGSSDA